MIMIVFALILAFLIIMITEPVICFIFIIKVHSQYCIQLENEGKTVMVRDTTTCHTIIEEPQDDNEIPFVSDYNKGKDYNID